MTAATEVEPPVELALTGISKSFGGTPALAGVDVTIRRGQVHALLGGNGSGKSTLIKIMAGVYHGDEGHIRVGDREVAARHTNPAWAYAAGLRFVHQDTGIFVDHTVAENFALGATFGHGAFAKVNWRNLNRRVRETLERFDLDVDPKARMSSLRATEQTLVAVARALDSRGGASSVLILDEPTASLPHHEVDQVHRAIRGYTQRGHTVVLVSHRVDDILAVADRATFLRDGHVAGERPVAGLDERVILAEMAGAQVIESTRPPRTAIDGDVLLQVSGLAVGRATDVSFELRKGEILGLAGIAGAGRSSVLRAIAGMATRQAGRITLAGRPVPVSARADQQIRRGVVYVPAERGRDAAFPDRPVRENFLMPRTGAFWRGWRVSTDAERAATETAIARYGIKPPRPEAGFASLSGGNQQKVVMARWLELDPQVVLLDEPTQGVDVAARSALHEHIRDAAERGVGVIVASSDPRELAELSDRVLGLSDGRISVELTGARITPRSCIEAAYGLRPESDQPTDTASSPSGLTT